MTAPDGTRVPIGGSGGNAGLFAATSGGGDVVPTPLLPGTGARPTVDDGEVAVVADPLCPHAPRNSAATASTAAATEERCVTIREPIERPDDER